MNQAHLAEVLKPRLPSNPVIITPGPLLGLGDTAVYSTLAERFSKLGYDVYLDKDAASSNQDIYDLFWKMNPFIKGLSDKKPNAGYVRQGLFYEIANRLQGCRSIEAMEQAHALPPPYGIAPKVYYDPKPFPVDLSDRVLLDFSAVSSTVGNRGVSECIRMMNGKFRNPEFLQVLFPKFVALHTPPIYGNSYMVSSIYEYLDMLHAAKGWVGSEAGGQSLASAVRGEREVYDDEGLQVICTITPRTYNSRGYTYRNVDYRVTCDTDTSADYWKPHEVEVHKYEVMCELRKIEMGLRRE